LPGTKRKGEKKQQQNGREKRDNYWTKGSDEKFMRERENKWITPKSKGAGEAGQDGGPGAEMGTAVHKTRLFFRGKYVLKGHQATVEQNARLGSNFGGVGSTPQARKTRRFNTIPSSRGRGERTASQITVRRGRGC